MDHRNVTWDSKNKSLRFSGMDFSQSGEHDSGRLAIVTERRNGNDWIVVTHRKGGTYWVGLYMPREYGSAEYIVWRLTPDSREDFAGKWVAEELVRFPVRRSKQ